MNFSNEHSLFSADVPARFAAGPLGHAPVASVTDVILATIDPNVVHSDPRAHPPILMPEYPDGRAGQARDPQPIDLGRGVELLRLDQAQAERIMNACQPRGHFFFPVRQYGQRYTFRRAVAREDWEQHLYRWDPEGVLTDALQMSRLVLDNAWSTEFGARIIDHENGQQQIMWLPNTAPIYRLQPLRDWMTSDEADSLRLLLSAYWTVRDSLPARVRRALWNAEYMCRVHWLDIRVPLLVISFEGLISTSQSLVARQFRERVPRLADEVGARGITSGLCRTLYGARSRWAHGSHIALRTATPTSPQPEGEERADGVGSDDASIIGEIALFQTALRQTVRRCIEDIAFASAFATDESIRARWPVGL